MTIQTETLVIGAGPGGYVAAIRAAQLGQKVTIVEAEHIGGVCLNVGCIPSKALINAGHRYQEAQHSAYLGVQAKEVTLDFAKTQKWKDEKVVRPLTSGVRGLLKKNGVQIIEGFATFESKESVSITTDKGKETVVFKHAIIASGSRPIEIPGFAFGERVLDSTGGLNLPKLPDKMVIIGGGYIGCELAGAYADLGTEITLIEGTPSLLPAFETDIQQLVTESFKQKGARVITGAKAKQATVKEDQVVTEIESQGKTETITSDYVMVTVGRRPNTDNLGLEKIGIIPDKKGLFPVNEKYQTEHNNIYAIGDVVEGLALAHKASYEAKVAAEVISGKNVTKDYRVIPAICFTDPEIATVGYTKDEALKLGFEAEAATFPMQANGRALSLNATEGFVRLVFDKQTQLVMGAQIVGVNASDLVAELTVAIESYLTLEDIALIIHGHPTLSEMVMDASEVGLGSPIHI